MAIQNKLLEQWKHCQERRYPVLVIITTPKDSLFTVAKVDEFAEIIKAAKLDFQERYKDKIDHFFTWQAVREEIYQAAGSLPIIVTELEPFYAKWPKDERIAFLKNLLRSEPAHPIVVIINCQEDLSDLYATEENNRGIIWAPSNKHSVE